MLMIDDALIRAVIDYGADIAGIEDRFSDNRELYARCFNDFVKTPRVAELKTAMENENYEDAFDAAHALKGLSGNLGLSAYYNAICLLVESLREKNNEQLDAQYAAVEHEYENAVLIYEGKPPKPFLSAGEKKLQNPCERTEDEKQPTSTAPTGGKKTHKKKQERDKAKQPKANNNIFLYGAAITILAIFLISIIAFSAVGKNYRNNTMHESGQHLLETAKQISMHLEEQLFHDRLIAQSISKGITGSNYTDNDDTFLTLVREQRETWNITELMLYTETGYCIYSDGTVQRNGISSDTLASAIENGSDFSIIDSHITYTLPIITDHKFHGARIQAVSVVRDMESFLDDLDFASFDNSAWMYLTDEDGIIISMSNNSNAPFSFNINTIINNHDITPLSKTSPVLSDVFSSDAAAFYMTGNEQDMYLISVPVSSDDTDIIRMRLFYIVPEIIVNSVSSEFSFQLTVLSIVTIVLLVSITSIAFHSMYSSRKRKFDAALSSREQMFDLLIQNMHTVFGLFNTNQNEPVYISANALEVLGDKFWTIAKNDGVYRAQTDSGREPEMLQKLNTLLKNWDGKSEFRSGYLFGDKAVPPAWFELILFPVGQSEDEFVGIIQDVTSTHEREEATKSALELAKRSDEAKSLFLANMSHDIRTPMNAIINMSRFALGNENNPEMRTKYLKTIYESSEQLLHLVNNILDTSRIESGQTVFEALPFNLKTTLTAQFETLRPLFAEKQQTIVVDFDGINDETVLGDSLKLMQIVTNLLSNAIKFTPPGGTVIFSVSCLPSLRDDMLDVRFSIKDSGIGISEEDLPHIFEPFFRANDPRVGKIEGTGLGLSLCKSFVEAMGGTITCESKKDEGSTFTVELFFSKAFTEKDETTVIPQSKMIFYGMRCLVVEDILTNQIIAKELLERIGFSVDCADNGKEGAEKFLNSKPMEYDVIYMDIRMSVLDGYDATALIRRSNHPQADTIPIIAMTANVFAQDIEKARISGMDGFIGKPIASRELTEQTINAIHSRKGK